MDESKLIYKLREFYSMELYQLDLYKAQLKTIEETHIQKAYERFIIREREHVDYYYKKLKELDAELPKPVEAAATFAGFVSGKALDLMSLKDRYKLGVAVENKAVNMYETFIQMADTDPKLADLTDHLWYFMMDEEMHQYWFQEYLSWLEAYNDR